MSTGGRAVADHFSKTGMAALIQGNSIYATCGTTITNAVDRLFRQADGRYCELVSPRCNRVDRRLQYCRIAPTRYLLNPFASALKYQLPNAFFSGFISAPITAATLAADGTASCGFVATYCNRVGTDAMPRAQRHYMATIGFEFAILEFLRRCSRPRNTMASSTPVLRDIPIVR